MMGYIDVVPGFHSIRDAPEFKAISVQTGLG
jgi:hypothetical protein